MAKGKDGSGLIIIIVIVFSLFSAVWSWSKENWHIVVMVFGVFLLFLFLKSLRDRNTHKKWVAFLKEKYQNDQVVNGIVNGSFWEGQTTEMLRDSLGTPDDRDETILKTKTKSTWKYGHKHSNQYRLRIFIENDRVVGWEKKA